MEIVEEVDYVGISPANDLHEEDRIRWVEFVFSYIERNGYKIKTHGFAATGWKMMMAVPWTSCDSITYRLSAFYGNVYVPRYGYDDERSYEEPPYRVAIFERLSEGGVHFNLRRRYHLQKKHRGFFF